MALTSSEPNRSKSNNNSKILRSFSILLSSQVITWGLTSIYMIITPRYLGPENAGRLALAYAVIYTLQIFCDLGMPKLFVREIAIDHSRAAKLTSALQIWRLSSTLVFYIGLLITINVLDYPEAYRPIFYFVGITMVLDMLNGGFYVLFQGLEKFRYAAWLDITIKGTTLGVALLVIALGGAVWWIAAAMTVAHLVGVVQCYFWSRRLTSLKVEETFKTIRWLIWNGLPFWGTSVLLIIYTYIDALLLSWLADERAVGLYSTPTRLFTTAMFLPGALSAAIFPVLSRLYTTDRPAMVDLAARSLRWLVTGSMPVAVLVITLSPNVIPLLFGDAFKDSIPVMMVLGLTLFSTYVNILANQFLVATNRQLEWTKVMVVFTVLNPLMNLGLITYFHAQGNAAVGAAWSLFLTETLMLIPAFLLLPRGIFDAKLIKQSLLIGLACLPMAAVVWYLNGLFFVIPAVIGMVVFAGCAWVLRALPLDELAEAKQLILDRRKNAQEAV